MPALMLMWGNSSPTHRSPSFSSQPSLYGSTSSVGSQNETEQQRMQNAERARIKSRSMSYVGGMHCGKRKCSDCTPTISLKSLISLPRRHARERRASEMDSTSFGGPSPTSSRRGSRISGLNVIHEFFHKGRNSLSPPRSDYYHSRSRSDLGPDSGSYSLQVPNQNGGDIRQSISCSDTLSAMNDHDHLHGNHHHHHQHNPHENHSHRHRHHSHTHHDSESSNNFPLLPNGDVSIYVPNLCNNKKDICDTASDNAGKMHINIIESDNKNVKTGDNLEVVVNGDNKNDGDNCSHCMEEEGICISIPSSPVSNSGRVTSLTESGYYTFIPKDTQQQRRTVFSIYEETPPNNNNTATTSTNTNTIPIQMDNINTSTRHKHQSGSSARFGENQAEVRRLHREYLHENRAELQRLQREISDEYNVQLDITRPRKTQLLSINGHLIRDERKISNFSLASESSIGLLGRDFESVYTNHKYTKSEREILASHDSFDYLPSHSVVYKEWLQRQPARLDWDRWLMMALIGITIGIVGFLLHQAVHLIGHLKWHKANEYLHQHQLLLTWGWVMGYSLLSVALSAASVVFICLPAGGSGIPEVIGFLNGTVMRHVLNLRAFTIKFFSCVCAVGGGLPVGPEGPMIHMGSIVGTGLSQFRSRTLGISLPFFQRFRNSEDRRNFTAAGAAAGVASAFTAPVGGLLFGMEEVSSFWSMKLGWMIFFACMLASFTTDIFNSSFSSFRYRGIFGLFVTDKYILFKLGNAIPVNVIMFIPAMVLGILGGVFGALFTITNLKIARLRRRILTRLRRPWLQKVFRFVEPLVIMAIWATITVFLPAAFPCKPMICPTGGVNNITNTLQHYSNGNYAHNSNQSHLDLSTNNHHNNYATTGSHDTSNTAPHDSGGGYSNGHHNGGADGASINESLQFCPDKPGDWLIDKEVHQYTCHAPVYINGTLIWGEYNEVASLLNVQGQDALRMLFSRRSHHQFTYPSLLTVLTLYFFMTCWASSSAVACGIVVPMLFIGGLYGRVIGKLILDLHGGVPTSRFWKWIDPGALALIGAASFFGGVSRLTMSLTVIMIEITNDVAFLLPIMIAIMFAKWVGDYITHPIYHSLLEIKCIPYLDSEPIVYDNQNNLLNLELYKARNVMHSPVITVTIRESVAHISHLLLETTHGGFPVVKYHDESRLEVAYGLLTRTELCVILCDQNIQAQKTGGITITPEIPYEEVSIDRIPSCINLVEILEKYVETPHFKDVYIDLEPYVNRSSSRIEENFSLHRTYIVFRTLGLRHLMVVDMANRVVGIITRKDLMGFNLEERLVNRKLRGYSIEGGITKLLPSEYDEMKYDDIKEV